MTFDMNTISNLAGFGALDKEYHCEICNKQISETEFTRNAGICPCCAIHKEIS